MESDVIRVRINDDPIEVAHTIAKYDLIAVPVIDAAQRLVGIVTVDDAMDLLDPEVNEPSASGREGAKPSVLGYVDRAAWATNRSRGLWVVVPALILICAWLALAGSGSSVKPGSASLALLVMSLGLPLMISLGVSPGARCAVSTARDLARERPGFRSFLRNLGDELRFGLPTPVVVLLAVWGVFALRQGAFPEAHGALLVVVGVAGVGQVLFAAIIGGLSALLAGALDLALERFVAPSILSVPDAVGVLLYFAVVAPKIAAIF